MSEYGSSEDHQPILWLRGYPVYGAYLIVLVFVASMLVTTLLLAFNAGHVLGWLTFSGASVRRGEAWRVLTYGLVNPPSLTFVIDMYMIAMFGRELEKFFGRRKFLLLYGCLYLLSPLLFTVVGIWAPVQLSGETGAFALFIAFATLYPNVAIFFGLLAKWVALILVGIFSLAALAYHDWVGGISLWVTSGFAFAFIRFERSQIALPSLRLPRMARRAAARPALPAGRPAKDGTMAEVDAILDKIALSGFASLTDNEKARLDAARDQLGRRGPGR